jgi:uncharacterized membrane protein
MRRDLALVVALACAALLAALLPAPTWARAALLLPLVLFLPGYATVASLFAPGTITATERAVYAIAFSIAIAVLGGLVAQLALDLSRDVWAVLLTAVTVIAALRAPRTRPEPGLAWPKAVPWKVPVAGLAFLAAAAIAAAAIVSAGQGLRDAQAQIRFTSLWMLPRGSATRGTAEMLIGLRNHEAHVTKYDLRLSREGNVLATRRVTLRAGQKWERSFAVGHGPGDVPVVATLTRDGLPYRRLDALPPR